MCKKCDYQATLDRIDEMVDDEDYEFAGDTLRGIQEWVEREKHVTDKQERAVENIYRSKRR